MLGIDGKTVRVRVANFQGLTSLEILRKIQKDLQEQNIEPEKFEDRIIFLSMFGREEDIFRTMYGHYLDLEAKRSGVENQITFLKENGKTQPT